MRRSRVLTSAHAVNKERWAARFRSSVNCRVVSDSQAKRTMPLDNLSAFSAVNVRIAPQQSSETTKSFSFQPTSKLLTFAHHLQTSFCSIIHYSDRSIACVATALPERLAKIFIQFLCCAATIPSRVQIVEFLQPRIHLVLATPIW